MGGTDSKTYYLTDVEYEAYEMVDYVLDENKIEKSLDVIRHGMGKKLRELTKDIFRETLLIWIRQIDEIAQLTNLSDPRLPITYFILKKLYAQKIQNLNGCHKRAKVYENQCEK